MLTTHQLTVTYSNGHTALRPVSLEFGQGDVTVLLGASGAGKSTLLRCLVGLETPTGGRVSSGGVGDIAGSPALLRGHRRRTGMIFQHHQLIQRRTALQNVLIGRLSSHPTWRTFWPLPKADQVIALECLERVGLLSFAMARVDQLSGGQQQRVGIARALASRPEILLADEPVASLDPASAASVMSLIRRICKEDGLTAVVSLHQVDLARQVADRIVGIRAGTLAFDGTPAEFTSAHAEALYAQDTVSARPASTIQPAHSTTVAAPALGQGVAL